MVIIAGCDADLANIKYNNDYIPLKMEGTNTNETDLSEKKLINLPQEQKNINKTEGQVQVLPENNSSNLLQICPEAWYDNQMPTVVENPNDPQPVRQYFIIDGQRREINQVDVNWVRQNCDIKSPQVVY